MVKRLIKLILYTLFWIDKFSHCETLSQQFLVSIESILSLNIRNSLRLLKALKSNGEILVGLVGGTTPPIHHLLNMYHISRSSTQREKITLILENVAEQVENVNEPFRQDPPVFYKALFIREYDLTVKLVSQTSADDIIYMIIMEDEWLTQFFSKLFQIPSETVPPTKLLLLANNYILKRPKEFSNEEKIRKFISNAVLTDSSKPTFKVSDFLNHSSKYNELINAMGKKDLEIHLKDIVEVLDELCQKILLIFLDFVNEKGDSSLFFDAAVSLIHILGRPYDPNTGHTPFHALCLSGSINMLKTLRHFYATAIDGAQEQQDLKHFALKLKENLNQILLHNRDTRGHTPASHALARYGISSKIGRELIFWCRLMDVDCSSLPNATLTASTPDLSDPSSIVDALSGDAVPGECHGSETGDWDAHKMDAASIAKGIDRNECDITEVWPSDLKSLEMNQDFEVHRYFFQNFVNQGKPVIFRYKNSNQIDQCGGQSTKTSTAIHSHINRLRSTFTKDRFLDEYGGYAVPISIIPYAGSFGTNMSVCTISELIQRVDRFDVIQSNIETYLTLDAHNRTTSQESLLPVYSFCTPSQDWNQKLMDDISIPSMLTRPSSSSSDQFGDYNPKTTAWSFEIQFYLGPAGTGAPVHYHGHAINSLAYGEKKWFLYPPSQTHYSATPSIDYLTQLDQSSSSSSTIQPMQCTQLPGDVIYVPTLWGHATWNAQLSVGVAHEFSVESYCME